MRQSHNLYLLSLSLSLSLSLLGKQSFEHKISFLILSLAQFKSEKRSNGTKISAHGRSYNSLTISTYVCPYCLLEHFPTSQYLLSSLRLLYIYIYSYDFSSFYLVLAFLWVQNFVLY